MYDAAMSPPFSGGHVQPVGPATPHPAAARKRKGKLEGEPQSGPSSMSVAVRALLSTVQLWAPRLEQYGSLLLLATGGHVP